MSGRPIAQAEDCMDAEVSRRAKEHEHAPHMSRVFRAFDWAERLPDCGGITLAACCGLRVTKSADVAGVCPALREIAEERHRDAEAIAEAATRPTMRLLR
jgi:hypothetical protein